MRSWVYSEEHHEKLLMSPILIPREADSGTCVLVSALVLCVATTRRKNRLYRSVRLTRITLVAEKLPSR